VIGPTGQGIAPGEFAELVRAIRAGATYANVHTDKHPTGEIRGHIQTDDDWGTGPPVGEAPPSRPLSLWERDSEGVPGGGSAFRRCRPTL
jgi:hypothetical protein